jgi:hypothetical protein
LLNGVAPADQAGVATNLVQKRFKTNATVRHVEPVYEEQEITSYMAITTP